MTVPSIFPLVLCITGGIIVAAFGILIIIRPFQESHSQYTKIPCGTLCKTQHRINESVVLELVKDLLKAIAEYAKHKRAEFVRVVQEAQSSQQMVDFFIIFCYT